MPVPTLRIRRVNDRAINSGGDFVLYWMTMARRPRANYGLDRAVEHARHLTRPLVILEALRCDYPDASDRLHQFLLDGMADNARAFARSRALYYPFVETRRGEGRRLIRALSERACVIVTDDFPAYFVPRMIDAAAAQSVVSLEAVDSNGLIPLDATSQAFPLARTFRSFVQRVLVQHLAARPSARPLAPLSRVPRLEALPTAITRRWPCASPSLLRGREVLAALPIDHTVPVVAMRGGHRAALRRMRHFLDTRLDRYADDRNHPDADGTSRLSPYLHFGHLGAHEIFEALMTNERWTTRRLGARASGRREGWWGVSPSADAFLDQLVVWRELAFNTARHLPRFDCYATLPDWARATLARHRSERRKTYDDEALEAATTGDDLWNAAQRQLRTEGWFHGYLRMLWGKKLLEWSRTGEQALDRMQRIMDRWSLDGRDPNSWAGYMWVLGRYDRPWPERPAFGTVRCMTSASARRKLQLETFLARYGDHKPAPPPSTS